MDLQFLSFTPRMVENNLNLIEWKGFFIEVADDEIFVDLYSFLKNNIGYKDSWSISRRYRRLS